MHLVRFFSFQALRRRLLRRVQRSACGLRGQIWRDECGATAVEFALVAGTFVFLLLNGVDLGRYIYLRNQVENATQASVHAIWQNCGPMKLPVVSKCYASQAAAKTAVVNVISGIVNGVTDSNVTVAEGYYCADEFDALHTVTDVKNLPSQCLSGVVPGDYVKVDVTYAFAPLFGNLTVARLLGTSIPTTSYMRL